LFQQDNVPQSSNWTPIELSTESIARPQRGGDFHVNRTQFAMVECEAMTIHKAQGQTYSSVAVHLSSMLSRALLYVALSRVTELDGLYLFGRDTILSEAVRQRSKEQRLEEIRVRQECDQTVQEMKRMQRDRPFKNKFHFLSDLYLEKRLTVTNTIVSIMSHNCAGYGQNQVRIASDFGFKAADILFLSECHIDLKNFSIGNVSIAGYSRVSCTGNIRPNQACGQICFVRHSLSGQLHFVGDNADEKTGSYPDGSEHTEWSAFRLDLEIQTNVYVSIFFIHVYKHPKASKSAAMLEIEKVLLGLENEANPKFKARETWHVLLGDFNFDFNGDQKNLDTLKKYALVPTFTNKPTFNNTSYLDWVFTNFERKRDHFNFVAKSFLYETWFSDHTPIFTEIRYYTKD
jgi:hypothetical protein